MQKHFYRPSIASHFILLLVLVIFHSGNHLLSTPLNYYPLPPYVGARALAYFYYYISHITTWINFFMRRRPKKLPPACNQNSWEAKEPNQSLPFSPPFCDRPPLPTDWEQVPLIETGGTNAHNQSPRETGLRVRCQQQIARQACRATDRIKSMAAYLLLATLATTTPPPPSVH